LAEEIGSGLGWRVIDLREGAMAASRIAMVLGCVTMAAVCARAGGQAVAPAGVHHEANFEKERAKANELYNSRRELEALPMYADLSRQDPADAMFAERHAAGLFAKSATETDEAAAKGDRDAGMAELRRAQSLGDHSEYVENLLTAFGAKPKASEAAANPASPGYKDTQNEEAKAFMKQAEAAFARNDTATALADYEKASEADPGYYSAKLYAGDACFRASDYTCAGEWFEKAIAVDPNRETAYRYWGDALYKSGHATAAKTMYEQAVVAEPYTRFSWSGLSQWGTVTKTAMSSPPIQRPAIVDEGKGAKVTLPAGSAEDTAVWSAYAGCRVDAEHSRAAGSRRTVAEEMRCLELAVDFGEGELKAGKVQESALSAGVRSLIALRRDGMLECWVLLNGADQEILRDYPAYRDGHRELLRAYVDKYVVHQDAGPVAGRPQLQVQP
jgi:tetratricopeptide (TPR) repeat protein